MKQKRVVWVNFFRRHLHSRKRYFTEQDTSQK